MLEYKVILFESVMREITVEAKDENEARLEALKQIPNSHVHLVEKK